MTQENRRPSHQGVEAAAERIAGHVTVTPLLPFVWKGRRLFAKAECLQRGGSFKLRGATNRIVQLREDQKAVLAFSSGNHAQGVAIAAARAGRQATIVMPADAPAVKRAATEAAGATVVTYDREREDRVAIATKLAVESGAVLIPPFDDVDIIEGQGSVGVEVRGQFGGPPPVVLVPCGGGGLTAGVTLALPESRVVPVEPFGWDDMARSLLGGAIVPVEEPAPPTLCDSLQPKLVSPLTYGALAEAGARGLAVTDAEVEAAMRFAFATLRVVVEPGGSAALAALLSGKAGDVPEGSVVVLSGGNVDPALYARVIAG